MSGGSQAAKAGEPIFDTVKVGNTHGATVSAVIDLFGPFPSSTGLKCDGAPIWSGTVSAEGDGSYKTGEFTPTVPGVYTYRARINGTDLVRATENTCGEVAETTVVSGEPKVVTQVSAAQVSPGSQIKDSVIVSGSGVLELTIDVQLFGPFATRSGINCSGTPAWTGTVSSKGDGVYETQPVTLEKVGYYTYRESIAATTTSAGFAGKCGETSETTLAAGQPTVTTIVSNDVVRPGGSIYDRILVSGLGQTEAAIDVKLYGPFATKAAITCTGKPYWQGRVTAQGDGELHSPAVRIAKAGFYTFHETLVGRDHVESVTTECGVAAETSLGAPAIITGRGDHTRVIAAARAGSSAPTRVKIPSLNIDVPVVASGIDIAHGILGVPADIHKTGWWSDGAAPGDPTGSVVIAGHVDSAAAGPGAFYNLKNAKAGALITVTTANGATKTYKVTSVRTMLKADLPLDIWSQKGANHLELVTCGGPFDSRAGHYRDNIVVTAVST